MDNDLFKIILQVLGLLLLLGSVATAVVYIFETLHDINERVEELHDKFIDKDDK